MAALTVLTLAAVVATSSTTVMTYNVQYDASAEQRARTLELIQQQAPDVLCVQEVSKPFMREFDARLRETYPHRKWEPRSGTWGLGIVSRYPVREFRVFPQKPHKMPAAEAVVVLPEQRELRVVCVHLFPPVARRNADASLMQTVGENAELRVQQAQGLVDRYRQERRPVLVLGDFNEPSSSGGLEVLRGAGFQEACSGPLSCGPTWPGANSPWPAVVQIDHILGRGVSFSNARTVRGGGSDHLAVTAELAALR
ncbi:MAG: endonuclease/exonuclease/phosphatase family protein [Myxococcota bacterium]